MILLYALLEELFECFFFKLWISKNRFFQAVCCVENIDRNIYNQHRLHIDLLLQTTAELDL